MTAHRLQFVCRQIERLRMDRRAQDLTEYALLLCMVAFVIYGWLPSSYSPALSNIWAKVSSVMLVLTGS